jgi:hypothetical protein
MSAIVKDEQFYRGKLFAASWRGDHELVKEVIEAKNVNVNVVDADGVSALRFLFPQGPIFISSQLFIISFIMGPSM